ncbi:hypothetical protein OD781_08805 [Pseudomonas aeruginosa]|nr:hypothetical protein [Pseudomonas aeruginosa]MCV4061232.1 hypothetical protein [Pseudomonas aeruginosa]MCV4077283.1 hypothetical protein [Pseudomonas aeruginosa]MCV4148646.1 hypothetical protein [Pseudomonas aeruginosa]MCV4180551.1 hypothetical protein [Pseudomonas aeruginosa]MCV4220014.1 hypothetical protein [Pseudomonas aeruginosa]
MTTQPVPADETSNSAGMQTDFSLALALYHIATGQTPHVYNGMCPDALEGHAVRDDECPACKAIIRFEESLQAAGIADLQQIGHGA